MIYNTHLARERVEERFIKCVVERAWNLVHPYETLLRVDEPEPEYLVKTRSGPFPELAVGVDGGAVAAENKRPRQTGIAPVLSAPTERKVVYPRRSCSYDL